MRFLGKIIFLAGLFGGVVNVFYLCGMEKFRLSRGEKSALRSISLGMGCLPAGMDDDMFSVCAGSLERLGLVRVAWASGHVAVAAELTDAGAAYMLANPKLRNPVNWPMVAAVCAALSVAVSIVALLVACDA